MLTEFERMRQDISDSEKEVVHLLPRTCGGHPGATAVCQKCRTVFQTRTSAWTTDSNRHGTNRFKGAFRSCSPN